MASNDEKIIIEIELDDGSLAKGFVKSESVAKKEGKKAGKAYSDSVNTGVDFKGIESKLLSLGAGLIASLGIRETINASIEQDKAVQKLDSSLRSLGRYTPELSKELQNYASTLQDTSRFGDEATLGQLAFAQAMGANVEQSKEIVKAAQDMAIALDIDFNSAVRNITKTLGGYAGELGEVIPELKNLSAVQLQSGQGVDLLSEKFRGFAERDLQSFDGKLAQSTNTLGDFAEALGDLVTKSETGTGVLSDFKFIIADMTSALKELTSKDDIDRQKQLTDELAKQQTELQRLQSTLLKIESGTNEGSFLDNLFGGVSAENVEFALKSTRENISGLYTELEALKASDSANNSPIVSVKEEDLTNIRTAQSEYEKLIQTYTQLGFTAQDAQAIISDPQFAQDVAISNETISLSMSKLGSSLAIEARKIKITNGQIAATMINGIGGATAQAFRAFGQALVEGENALEAMLNSFLSSMGNMSVQLGSMYILQGAAMLFSPNPIENAKGGPLIQAGAALAAFGGVLGAIGGSSSSSTSSSTSTASQNEVLASPTLEETSNETETVERRSVDEYHFHGEILGDDRSAERIVEYLQIAKNNGAIA